jgi:hypothetical protein
LSTAANAAAIAVAIAATTTACLCFSRCWLVVALFSAVSFCHRTPSCNRQPSRCWPLLPPIVIHHRCYRCRQAATATTTTATPVVKLTLIHIQRKRQQQHHHQRTNGSTNVKRFTTPDDMDLFYLSTVFLKCVMLVEEIY